MELFCRSQQGIGFVPRYEEICRKVEILQERYECRSARRTNYVPNFLTYSGSPASLAVAVMGGRLVDQKYLPVLPMLRSRD